MESIIYVAVWYKCIIVVKSGEVKSGLLYPQRLWEAFCAACLLGNRQPGPFGYPSIQVQGLSAEAKALQLDGVLLSVYIWSS